MMCPMRKVLPILRKVTLEPCLFLYCVGLSLNVVGVDSIFLQKFCSPEERPANLSRHCDPEAVSRAADVVTAQGTIVEALNGLLTIFAGLWRDKKGLSTPTIYFGLVGTILSCVIYLASAYFWTMSPWLTGVLAALVLGLTGSKQIIYFGAACFIGANSKEEERTIRLSLMLGFALGGGLLGNFVSGYILSYFGYIYFFIILIAIYTSAIIFGVIFISEKPNKPEQETKLFNISRYLIVFKKRSNRSVIWILIINIWMNYTILTGDTSLLFFYIKAAYNMTVTEIGIFLSYSSLLHFVGTILVTPLLIKFFRWSDFTLAMVSIALYGFSALGTTFNRDKILFIALTSLNILKISMLTFHRSIITKSVNSDELGVFLSVCGLGEGILPIAFLPLYDIIFKGTVHTLPGAFYGMSAVAAFIGFVNLLIAKHLSREKPETPALH